MNPVSEDKTHDALKAQRFRMLEDIARELAGDLVFPVHFDLSLHARAVLRSPRLSADRLAGLLAVEPLLAAKVLRMANALPGNDPGRPVLGLPAAVRRLGTEAVRTSALPVVDEQLRRSRPMAAFGHLARRLWEHSLLSAVAAGKIAARLTSLDPDEAMLAGLIHDLGAFYMLYRAARYPELCARPETLTYLIIQWHESIGDALMAALEVPESILRAIREHDQPRPEVVSPKTLGDVVFVANLLADGGFEWLRKDLGGQARRPEAENPAYLGLTAEIRADFEALRRPVADPA